MKGFVFSLFTLFTVSAFAQTTLTGYVTLQNSGGKPAFPAQVSAFGATDTDVDKDKGYFKLIFDRKHPGQDVLLEVEREGYEVVNKRSLAHRLPEAHEVQRPLKLYLCPKGQWQRYAAKYEGINLEAIERTYEKKLAELQGQLENKSIEAEDYRYAAFQLAKDKKIAEAQAQELAEKFAKANLDEATDRFVLAHRLFTVGKIDSVLIVLDEEKMKADLATADKDIREGKELIAIGEGKVLNGTEAREKIVEEFMVKARAHIIKLEWVNAEHAFEVAVHADSSHADNWFEYALFLYKQNQFNRAQPIYEHCLSLQKAEPDIALTLNNLGRLYMAKNDFTKAEKSYLRALEIRERLTNENPQVYEPDVATTLNNLGILYKTKNELPKAEKSYLQALETRERLAKANPWDYEPYVALTLNNLGVLYSDKNDFAKAEKSYLRAQEIYECLVNENPRDYEPYLAHVLNNLGILYKAKNDFTKAENSYLCAVEIRERLAKTNPRTYEPYVAMSMNNLGGLYLDKNDFTKAEESYLRAQEIYECFVKENPRVYEPYLAHVLNNLGILYLNKNDFTMAEKSHLRALEIRERLAKETLRTYEPDVAVALHNLGVLYKAKNDFSKAEKSYLRALEIKERLSNENPWTYEPGVAITLHYLGVLYQAKNDFTKAEKSYLRALEIRERLAKENQAALNIDLCRTYYALSLYCLARLKSSEGETKWREQGMKWLEKGKETLTIYPKDLEPRVQLSQDILNVADVLQNYNRTLAAYQK